MPGSTATGAKRVELRDVGAAVLVPFGLTVLWLLALLLMARRFSDNLAVPLDTPFLMATGWTLFAWGFGLRAGWKQPDERGVIRRVMTYLIVAILPMLLCSAALSLPGSPRLGIWLLWLLVGGITLWSLFTEWSAQTGFPLKQPKIPVVKKTKKEESVPLVAPGSDPLSGDMLQQFTRLRDAEGKERLAGMARAEFQPGQRQASLHIAFCPPFEKTPELENEQLEGPKARIKIGQLQPFGARLDLRLTRAETEPQSIMVRFEARENPEE